MSSVWTIVLAFIALVFFSISATVHGDCASCCQGKCSQCFTICEDMDQYVRSVLKRKRLVLVIVQEAVL